MNLVHCESQSLSSRDRTHFSGRRTWHRREQLTTVELIRHRPSWWTILVMYLSWAHRIYPLCPSMWTNPWQWLLQLVHRKAEATLRAPISWQDNMSLPKINSTRYRYRRQMLTIWITKEAQVAFLRTAEEQLCHQWHARRYPQISLC